MPTVQRVIEIACLQRGPEALPFSHGLLVAAAAVSAGSNLAAGVLFPLGVPPLVSTAVFLIYTAVFVQGVLQLYGLGNRFVQTLSAVFATDAVITGVSLGVLSLFPGDAITTGPVLASLGLLVWYLAVFTHILRHALDRGLTPAALWAVGYWFGTEFLLFMVRGGGS